MESYLGPVKILDSSVISVKKNISHPLNQFRGHFCYSLLYMFSMLQEIQTSIFVHIVYARKTNFSRLDSICDMSTPKVTRRDMAITRVTAFFFYSTLLHLCYQALELRIVENGHVLYLYILSQQVKEYHFCHTQYIFRYRSYR